MNDSVSSEEKKTVIGPDGERIPGNPLVLGIERFNHPRKHYRLIWFRPGQAWLAEEDPMEYRRKSDIVEAGQALAEQVGAQRFSETTR